MKLQVRIGRFAESIDIDGEGAANNPGILANHIDALRDKVIAELRDNALNGVDSDEE